MQVKLIVFVVLGITLIGGFLFVPPLAQPLWYHNFADSRTFLAIPNAANVVSNLPLLAVGFFGLAFMASPTGRTRGTWFVTPTEAWPYFIFFFGLVLTGLGSAYYHWAPSNATLVWDRMPLAVSFMALFAAVLGERVAPRLGRMLLAPLVMIGIGSVWYWHWTELHSQGDLRPYLVVQFCPMLALPLILLFSNCSFTRGRDLWAALGLYALAKGLEALDAQIYSAGALVSGHTLKHLVAGASCYMVLHMIRWRRPTIPGLAQ